MIEANECSLFSCVVLRDVVILMSGLHSFAFSSEVQTPNLFIHLLVPARILKPVLSSASPSSDASGRDLIFDASTCQVLIGHRVARARIREPVLSPASPCSDPQARALIRQHEF